MMGFIVVQNIAQLRRDPGSPIFLTSLLPQDGKTSKLVWILAVLVHWQLWMNISCQLLLCGVLLYPYFHAMVIVLDEMVMYVPHNRNASFT